MRGSIRRRFTHAFFASAGVLGLSRCSLLTGLDDLKEVACLGACQDAGLDVGTADDVGGDAGDASTPSDAAGERQAPQDAGTTGDGTSETGADATVPSDASSDATTSPDAGPDAGGKCANRQLAVPGGASASSTIMPLGMADGPPSAVIDDNLATRWESVNRVDPQWLDLDFGAPVFIRDVQILWEAACAKNYTLQVSKDSVTWEIVATITNNTLAVSVFSPPADWSKAVDSPNVSKVGRYLRVNGTARCATPYGYSMWEMRTFGDTNASCMP